MSQIENMKEYDEKRKDTGFFFGLYKDVCENMTKEEVEKTEELKNDIEALVEFTYDLEYYKEKLKIVEEFPAKNEKESAKMKDAGNKAYQDGKDLQALTCYTQVSIGLGHNQHYSSDSGHYICTC